MCPEAENDCIQHSALIEYIDWSCLNFCFNLSITYGIFYRESLIISKTISISLQIDEKLQNPNGR